MTEQELMDEFIYLQKDLAPNVSIEVGAHGAEYSIRMAELGFESYAFEASPYVFNSKRKKIPANVDYVNFAVAEKSGIVKFELQTRFDPAIAGNNTIKNRNEVTPYDYIEVEATSLDEYFAFDISSGVDFALWIDVEGANGDVLLGAKEMLQRTSSIHIEVETVEFWKDQWLEKDVALYLAGFGFKEYKRCNVDIHGHQQNIIYLKS